MSNRKKSHIFSKEGAEVSNSDKRKINNLYDDANSFRADAKQYSKFVQQNLEYIISLEKDPKKKEELQFFSSELISIDKYDGKYLDNRLSAIFMFVENPNPNRPIYDDERVRIVEGSIDAVFQYLNKIERYSREIESFYRKNDPDKGANFQKQSQGMLTKIFDRLSSFVNKVMSVCFGQHEGVKKDIADKIAMKREEIKSFWTPINRNVV